MKLSSISEAESTQSESGESDIDGFVSNIDNTTVKNNEFRKVLYTAEHLQLVVMSLHPGESIGTETHDVDQFFRIENGVGEIKLDGVGMAIKAGFAAIVPAGVEHNIINTGHTSLKLYTIYAPPKHKDGTIHHIRADANNDEEEFDGITTAEKK